MLAHGNKTSLWRATGQGRSASGRLAGAFAVFLLFASAGVSAGGQEGSGSGGEERRIADDTDQLIEEITGEDAGIGPVSKIEESNFSDDQKGQLRLFATRVLNSQIEMRNAYMAELQRAGWDTILDPKRLAADASMEQSNRIVDEARSAAARLCREMRPRSEATARVVAAELNLPESTKRELLAGFLQATEEMAPTSDELCRLELAILEEIAGAVSVFGRDPDWQLDGEQYVFSEDRYVDEFNAHIQQFQALSETQTALQREVMTKASAQIRKAGF